MRKFIWLILFLIILTWLAIARFWTGTGSAPAKPVEQVFTVTPEITPSPLPSSPPATPPAQPDSEVVPVIPSQDSGLKY